MKYLSPLLTVSVLILGSAGSIGAHALPIQLVFSNTANTSGPIFGPGCCQVGNEITLGGDARKIVQVSWAVNSQNTNVAADVETQIYVNDGSGGMPGTLLWDSGLLSGVTVLATDAFLDIPVPKILVPNVITITSRILSSSPVALGHMDGGTPTVGNVDASWIESSPGVWQQEFGPWALRVSAVPEPSTMSLVGIAGVVLLRVARRDSRRQRAKLT